MIEVSNISFKYAGQKDLVFDDFSLRLEENNICSVRRRALSVSMASRHAGDCRRRSRRYSSCQRSSICP